MVFQAVHDYCSLEGVEPQSKQGSRVQEQGLAHTAPGAIAVACQLKFGSGMFSSLPGAWPAWFVYMLSCRVRRGHQPSRAFGVTPMGACLAIPLAARPVAARHDLYFAYQARMWLCFAPPLQAAARMVLHMHALAIRCVSVTQRDHET